MKIFAYAVLASAALAMQGSEDLYKCHEAVDKARAKPDASKLSKWLRQTEYDGAYRVRWGRWRERIAKGTTLTEPQKNSMIEECRARAKNDRRCFDVANLYSTGRAMFTSNYALQALAEMCHEITALGVGDVCASTCGPAAQAKWNIVFKSSSDCGASKVNRAGAYDCMWRAHKQLKTFTPYVGYPRCGHEDHKIRETNEGGCHGACDCDGRRWCKKTGGARYGVCEGKSRDALVVRMDSRIPDYITVLPDLAAVPPHYSEEECDEDDEECG